jgi:hypothetical protein
METTIGGYLAARTKGGVDASLKNISTQVAPAARLLFFFIFFCVNHLLSTREVEFCKSLMVSLATTLLVSRPWF